MNIVLKAQQIGVSEDDICVTVGFVMPVGEKLETLMIQRAFDPQDGGGPGLDGVYVERNDQQYAVYGGIIECSLHQSECRFLFSKTTAKELGDWEDVRIEFNIDENKFAQLLKALQFIFTDCSCFNVN